MADHRYDPRAQPVLSVENHAVTCGHPSAAARAGLTLNEVAQVFQFDGEVDIVDHHLFRHRENDGRKIQNARNPGINQIVGDGLGSGGGHGENRHLDRMFADERGHFIHAENGLLDFLVTLAAGFGIKGGENFKTFFFKPAIGDERKTQVADADEDDRLQTGGAEFVGNFSGQFVDIVAEAARAECAEVGEIFAELSGLDAGGLGERLAGNRADAVLAQAGEAAQINREAINRFARNDGATSFFHRPKIRRRGCLRQAFVKNFT